VSTTFPFNSPYNLEAFQMNAGSNQELTFAVYDEYGNPLTLSGATITWYLSNYGSSVAVVTKTAVAGSAVNNFVVYLDDADTSTLYGKFVQQYSIVDTSGSVFRPSTGLIDIYPALV